MEQWPEIPFMKLIPLLSPALLVLSSYVETGNWASGFESKARYGFDLLWVVFLFSAVSALFRMLSYRLSTITGKSFAQVLSDEYPKAISLLLFCLSEVSALATDLSLLLMAAVGFNISLGFPLLGGVLLIAADALLLDRFLPNLDFQRAEYTTAGAISLALIFFVSNLFWAQPLWGHSIVAIWPSIIHGDDLYTVVGLLGAVAVPHTLFLRTQNVTPIQQARIGEAVSIPVAFIGGESVVASSAIATVINVVAMVFVAASFEGTGLVQDATFTSDQGAGVLRFFQSVLGLGLVFAAELASLSCTQSCEIMEDTFLGFRLPHWQRRLLPRVAAGVPTVAYLLAYGAEGAFFLLMALQLIPALVLPFLLFPLIKLSSSQQLMGQHSNSPLVELFAWLSGILVFGLDLWLIVKWFPTSLGGPEEEWAGMGLWEWLASGEFLSSGSDLVIGLSWGTVWRDVVQPSFALTYFLTIGTACFLLLWLLLTPLKKEAEEATQLRWQEELVADSLQGPRGAPVGVGDGEQRGQLRYRRVAVAHEPLETFSSYSNRGNWSEDAPREEQVWPESKSVDSLGWDISGSERSDSAPHSREGPRSQDLNQWASQLKSSGQPPAADGIVAYPQLGRDGQSWGEASGMQDSGASPLLASQGHRVSPPQSLRNILPSGVIWGSGLLSGKEPLSNQSEPGEHWSTCASQRSTPGPYGREEGAKPTPISRSIDESRTVPGSPKRAVREEVKLKDKGVLAEVVQVPVADTVQAPDTLPDLVELKQQTEESGCEKAEVVTEAEVEHITTHVPLKSATEEPEFSGTSGDSTQEEREGMYKQAGEQAALTQHEMPVELATSASNSLCCGEQGPGEGDGRSAGATADWGAAALHSATSLEPDAASSGAMSSVHQEVLPSTKALGHTVPCDKDVTPGQQVENMVASLQAVEKPDPAAAGGDDEAAIQLHLNEEATTFVPSQQAVEEAAPPQKENVNLLLTTAALPLEPSWNQKVSTQQESAGSELSPFRTLELKEAGARDEELALSEPAALPKGALAELSAVARPRAEAGGRPLLPVVDVPGVLQQDPMTASGIKAQDKLEGEEGPREVLEVTVVAGAGKGGNEGNGRSIAEQTLQSEIDVAGDWEERGLEAEKGPLTVDRDTMADSRGIAMVKTLGSLEMHEDPLGQGMSGDMVDGLLDKSDEEGDLDGDLADGWDAGVDDVLPDAPPSASSLGGGGMSPPDSHGNLFDGSHSNRSWRSADSESGLTVGTGGGGGSGSGSLSRLSGLGRGARRQLAAVLDDFWGHVFDLHGQPVGSMPPGGSRKNGLKNASGGGESEQHSMRSRGFDSQQDSYGRSAASYAQREVGGSTSSTYHGTLAHVPRPSGMRSVLRDGQVEGPSRSTPTLFTDLGLYSDQEFDGGGGNPYVSQMYGVQTYLGRHSNDLSPDTRRLSLDASLPAVSLSPMAARQRYNGLQGLPGGNNSMRSGLHTDGGNYESSLHSQHQQQEQEYFIDAAIDARSRHQVQRLVEAYDPVGGHRGGIDASSLLGLEHVQRGMGPPGTSPWGDSSPYCGGGSSSRSDASSLDRTRDLHRRSGEYYEQGSPYSSTALYEGEHGMMLDDDMGPNSSLPFDQLAPSQRLREGFSLQSGSGRQSRDLQSFMSRSPHETLFGAVGEDSIAAVRLAVEQHQVAGTHLHHGSPGGSRQSAGPPMSQRDMKDVPSRLRGCIHRLLRIEGADWLFRYETGADEDLIASVAYREKQFSFDPAVTASYQLPLAGGGSQGSNSSRGVTGGWPDWNSFPASDNLVVTGGIPRESAGHLEGSHRWGCGNSCVWGQGLLISFGVWCVHRVLELSQMESRPELWGKYTYVLNRLQGILEAAFMKSERAVPLLCACFGEKAGLEPLALRSPHPPFPGSAFGFYPTSQQGGWPRSPSNYSKTVGPSPALFLDMIKDVETAVGARKGRIGTAAGDVAFPKGKENLASVLKRYKRRLSNKSPQRTSTRAPSGSGGRIKGRASQGGPKQH